jgi:hypothetical protein
MKPSTASIIAMLTMILLNFIYPTIEYRTASMLFAGMILIELSREQ